MASMIMLRSIVCGSAALLASFGGFAALAQSAPAPASAAPPIVLMGPAAALPAGQKEADETVVIAAIKAAQSGGLRALQPHEAALKAVLDHAPATYAKVERVGQQIVVRGMPGEDLGSLSMMATILSGISATKSGSKESLRTVSALNVYPMAALMLGSYAVETNRPADAIAALDKGLALQPREFGLVAEKGAALVRMGRHVEVLALYDAALAEEAGLLDNVTPAHKARLQRGRGYALVELNRLDDAEAAYKAAEVLSPNPRNAAELKYIAGLRAGAKPNAGYINLPGVAGSEQTAVVPAK